MRRLTRSTIAGLAIGVIGGCSDSTTSPRAAARRDAAPADRPSLDYSGPAQFAGSRTMTFSLTAAGGTFAIGGLYTLEVPANAVCVPGSTYGPGEWDSPCGTLAPGESILVMATYGFARGGPVVDFTPDIRFSPATEVRLSTDFYASYLTSHSELLLGNPELLRYFGIYYTADFGQTGKTDAAFDSALITHVDLGTGVVWRRVKHFSGYSATSGLPCTPAPDDPDCIEGTPPPVTHS